ncbi:FtsX-like permease family protein [Parabacteroides sp.]
MRTILRNFIHVLRRFKMASFLNIVGLAVAFTAFLVIMMQVEYERTFDRSYPAASRICRVDMNHGEGDIYASIVPRALADAAFASSPHIESSVLLNTFTGKVYVSIGEGSEEKGFKEMVVPTYPDFVDVFKPALVEGVANCLEDPEKVMISESMARRMFGKEPAVGKSLHLKDKSWYADGTNFTVGAVYKDFPENAQMQNGIYVQMNKSHKNDWFSQNYVGYILLDSPESRQLVEDNFNSTFDFDKYGVDKEIKLRLIPITDIYYMPGQLDDFFKTGNPGTIRLLILIALLIIVIAAINFTNFSTSLAPMRIKSINTQKVLGSSTGGLRMVLVIEAIAICVLSCLLSFLLTWLLHRTEVLSFVQADTNLVNYVPLLFLLLGMAIVLGVIAGLYPAWYMTSFQPALVLKGSFGLSASGRKLRTVLIGFQYVVSIGLIIGSFFIQIQNNYMRSYKLGFDKDQVAVVKLSTQIAGKSSDLLTNRLKEYSGIEDVGFASTIVGATDVYSSNYFIYNGKEFGSELINVSSNFLDVMGIPVISGRNFSRSDMLSDSTYACIFTQRVLDQVPDLEPGKSLQKDWMGTGHIVGLIDNIKISSLRSENRPLLLMTRPQEMLPISYIRLKAGTDVEEAVAHIHKVIADIDPAYPFEIEFYDTIFNNLYQKEQYLKKMITLFSLLAIILSIVGVFGLVVFETQYRRKEIGVRKVFGATVGEILNMFNRAYLKIVTICFILAIPFAYYGVHRWLENFSDKTPVYWWVFALAFVIVAAITMLTVTFQNWKAANENPVNSIKSE